MGDNVFLFRFGSEEEKKRMLMGGPWHFDRALIVLSEPNGVGNIKEQTFMFTSFWVQIHNLPIMCMNKDVVTEVGKKIGKVEEIDTNEAGECIGQFARVRISINVTQPLKKVVFVQVDGNKIPMLVLYEKLLDFYFCCAHIGHQYRECLKYKGQFKEELPYGGWMRAMIQSEKIKLNWTREKDFQEQVNTKDSNAVVNVPKPTQNQLNPIESQKLQSSTMISNNLNRGAPGATNQKLDSANESIQLAKDPNGKLPAESPTWVTQAIRCRVRKMTVIATLEPRALRREVQTGWKKSWKRIAQIY